MVGLMMVLVGVGVGTLPESDSDLRVSLARLSFFSLAFSRPALQNSSNLELMSSSDLLAAPAVVWLVGLSSMFSSSTSCNFKYPHLNRNIITCTVCAWSRTLLQEIVVLELVKKIHASYETRSVSAVKINVFWDVTPFNLVDTNVSEEPATFIFRIKFFHPEDGVRKFPQNTGTVSTIKHGGHVPEDCILKIFGQNIWNKLNYRVKIGAGVCCLLQFSLQCCCHYLRQRDIEWKSAW